MTAGFVGVVAAKVPGYIVSFPPGRTVVARPRPTLPQSPAATVSKVDITEEFSRLVARPEPEVRLDRVAMLIAAHGHPGLDVDHELERLDALAAACPEPSLDAVLGLLFGEVGLSGDHRDYYDPRNSYLDQVLSRRVGIPIALSVVTMEVARRRGVQLVGIGMPGHFLVRDGDDRDRFVDPYHGGAVLDRDACLALFHSAHGPGAVFRDSYLDPVGTLDITARMLANLRNVFVSRGDRRALTWVLRLRTALPGSPAEEQVDLAAALASVGRFGDAAAEYEQAAARLGGTLGQEYGRSATRLRARLN
jgi:regulator of sirC expression with transglutaminase-like and TPR domain